MNGWEDFIGGIVIIVGGFIWGWMARGKRIDKNEE
tara:strand:- start:7747 stop:7851 length:105 start_codon:yes stop_codon:yes gene_type:complete